ncbi:cytochrome c biogenesis CcdA family protein [Mycolicibacterium brisbanense]|uniref:Integral membrane protein n=1 Tax=Mycolicibacterium brisbanense TaxID=146020 RepID=A0A100VWM9_9MYCO|nr:cytochrome c biogenesis CcdA family protein [Mycolicibacterium brisbanense]MCV7162238.1 cytochrome c biogenesis protein CcdA [Mycolicibacterium brisbanense]GAS87314.1 integral membrane protein [Mycolicibacterium brisbanense]
MGDELVGLAFGAGLVAALNPCGFALLPGYLVLVVRGPDEREWPRAVRRALLATVAMTAGFVAVFGLFAALTVAVASTVQRYLPYVTVLIGLVLLGLGGWLLAGRHLGLLAADTLTRHANWAPTARLGSMFGYGVGYALASLSCTVGPFLAATGAAFRSGTPLRGVAVLGAYAAGFMVIVGVLAVAAASASTVVVDRIRRIVPHVNRISGALLIAVGAYVAYYGLYEIRLFGGGGSPDDPVIAGAGRVQGTIAGWVHQHGAWPWLAALAALAVTAALWRLTVRRSAKGRPADPATAGDES